jgi:sigma-B regulation protein RsbU (phosphoserine phosphatase)
MTIRSRLLRYALVITLLPLVTVVVFHRLTMVRLDRNIGAVAYESLTGNARDYLLAVVDDYGRLGDLSKRNVESLLRWQASEVEMRLAKEPPADGRIIYCEEFDEGRLPTTTSELRKYMRYQDDGQWTPIPISFDEQVYVLAPDVERALARPQMLRLADMTDTYRRLYSMNPPLVQWQYTALEVGFHSCYPGHGGYPESYDPRKRAWYTNARANGDVAWTLLPVVSSRTVALTASTPVYWPDGNFAGVTAIDVPLQSMLRELELPHDWAEHAETFHVMPSDPDGEFGGELVVIIQRSYEIRGRQWDRPVKFDVLTSDDTEGLQQLRRDAEAGRAGVRRMPYKGVDSIWAWSPYDRGRLISVVIVPYDTIVADAEHTRQIINLSTNRAMAYSAGVFFLALLAVTAVVVVRSRHFTEPIRQLSTAATRLAEGDFQTRVQIGTHDELEHLGGLVNDIGPQLAERDRMQRSLMIAHDIQIHLLPHEPPSVEGFDIAGSSNYCDETGGDYFDYIELPDRPGELGIAVGDITGHGVAAALLMATARAVLRSHAIADVKDLGRMLEDINLHLIRDTGDTRFLTLFYGVLDGPNSRLTWVSGGHDPAMWLRYGGDGVEELTDGSGMLLGVFEKATYTESAPITLTQGDVVVIGTDGIWEALNAEGEQFGKQRLAGVIKDNAARSAEEIVAAIQQEVAAFRGSAPQEDDITVVVVKKL